MKHLRCLLSVFFIFLCNCIVALPGAEAVPVGCSWQSNCSSAPTFNRGDVDRNGSIQMADASYLLAYLYQGGSAPACERIADTNGDRALNLTDATIILSFLYSGGAHPGVYSGVPVDSCTCTRDSTNPASISGCQGDEKRGDLNLDGCITTSDYVLFQNYLIGGPEPKCLESADWNDDRTVDQDDVDLMSTFLFQGGSPPCMNASGCPDSGGTCPTLDTNQC